MYLNKYEYDIILIRKIKISIISDYPKICLKK